MYLHLGEEVVVKKREVMAIFDLEKSSLSKDTKSFLANATKSGKVVTVSYEMPKSFVICRHKKGKEEKEIIYISQLSCSTLLKRFHNK